VTRNGEDIKAELKTYIKHRHVSMFKENGLEGVSIGLGQLINSIKHTNVRKYDVRPTRHGLILGNLWCRLYAVR